MERVNRLFLEFGETGIFESIIREHKREPVKPVPTSTTMCVGKFIGLYVSVCSWLVVAFLITIFQVIRGERRNQTLAQKVNTDS